MSKEAFAGDKKVGESMLLKVETRFKKWAVPKIPSFIETYHLTYMTVLWSLGNIVFAFLATQNLHYIWLVSLMIALQYITDLFDGELGRQRDTGLIKWGFYMDHFLDFLFVSTIVFVGYMVSPAGLAVYYYGLVVILGAFMVNSFLSFAATNEFEISSYGIGPTEMRIVFILINTFTIVMGTAYFYILLPITVAVCLAALTFNTYQIQKKLWDIDMEAKAARGEE